MGILRCARLFFLAPHVNLWVEIIKRRSASGSSFMSVTSFQVDRRDVVVSYADAQML